MSKYIDSKEGKLAKHNWTRVNSDGSYAEDYYDGTPFAVETDNDGYRYVDDGWDNTYIDEAVMHGFHSKPHFKGSEGYCVEHLDGDITNCSKDNLRWKELDRSETNKSGHVYFDGRIIGKDGSIVATEGTLKEQGQVRERWLDTDIDATWIFENPIMVTFEIGAGWYYPDEYMEKAGYVNGDKSSLKDPVILHRDYDVSNYHSGNLEWVESDDPRYLEYDKKRKQRQKELIKRYNTDLGYPIPESWPQ